MDFQPNYQIVGNTPPLVNINTPTFQPEYVAIDQTYFTASLAASASSSTGRFHTPQGANVNTATNLVLGNDGNVFSLTTVAATIDNIVSTGWSNGDLVVLHFNGSITVKHNVGGGGGTKLNLAGAVDFSATANDVLSLRLINTAWYEVNRSIN